MRLISFGAPAGWTAARVAALFGARHDTLTAINLPMAAVPAVS